MSIREGASVVFPTETVYGLGASALKKEAIKNIYKIKGRPRDNPFILHISSYDMLLYSIGEPLSEIAQKLIGYFWPGPLTIIFKKSKYIPDEVTAGLDTVAIRMPENKIALELIKRSGLPIAAPSANISGKPSPTRAEHVINDMEGKVDIILASRASELGVESTVIDISGDTPIILRPGGLSKEDLEKVLGKVDLVYDKLKEKETPKSPGMKYSHYAPEAKMTIIKGQRDRVIGKINQLAAKDRQASLKVGVLTIKENKDCYDDSFVISLGHKDNTREAAQNIFDALRAFDKASVDRVYAEAIGEEYLGLAVMNIMKKAAGYNIIEV